MITGEITAGFVGPEKTINPDKRTNLKKLKANMLIDELNHIKKKDTYKKRSCIGRHLYYLVKNGYMTLDDSEKFLKERGKLNKIDQFPYYRTLYEKN